MDSIKNAMGMGGNNNAQNQSTQKIPQGGSEQSSSGGGGFLGGIGDKFNSAAGGGKESEKNEDYLDKGTSSYTHPHTQLSSFSTAVSSISNTDNYTPTAGIDMVQQYGLGGGAQNNESAVEQAKDEQISDFIRGQYKSNVGSDMPIKDKETRFG